LTVASRSIATTFAYPLIEHSLSFDLESIWASGSHHRTFISHMGHYHHTAFSRSSDCFFLLFTSRIVFWHLPNNTLRSTKDGTWPNVSIRTLSVTRWAFLHSAHKFITQILTCVRRTRARATTLSCSRLSSFHSSITHLTFFSFLHFCFACVLRSAPLDSIDSFIPSPTITTATACWYSFSTGAPHCLSSLWSSELHTSCGSTHLKWTFF